MKFSNARTQTFSPARLMTPSFTLGILAAVTSPNLSAETLFQANFENSLAATIGEIDYNTAAHTAESSLVPLVEGPHSTLGSQVLLLKSNDTSQLSSTLTLSEPADLSAGAAIVSFDIAAFRINGGAKTTHLNGFDAEGEKVFSLVLGELNAFSNGSADRQRPGYQTADEGPKLLPGTNPPKNYWWGSDQDEASFSGEKSAHFELQISNDSWVVTTTKQDGTGYTSPSLPSYSGTSFQNLATLSLETTTGSSFGLYWDNLIVTGSPAEASLQDSDEDGMPDSWEKKFFSHSLSHDGTADFDRDGLSDLAEYSAGTNPTLRDTDGDLLSDGEEVKETLTNPAQNDSDQDGNPDGFEVAKGTDPKDAASRTEQPNIIFILADDLGYGDIGVLYQNEKEGKKHKTPFLDQMAADGMILDRHYCPAPVCAPSRGSLLTGLHQGHANVRDNQFDKALENNHNLATTLKSAGYSTNLIGKWGLQGRGKGPQSWPAYPTKRGFDYFFGYASHVAGHSHYPGHDTQNLNKQKKRDLYQQDEQLQYTLPDGTNNLNLSFTPDLFTAQAKKLIAEEVNDGDSQPFFLYLAYDTPHAALQLPPRDYPGENLENDLDDSKFGLKGGVQWLGLPGKLVNTATGTLDFYRHPDYLNQGWSESEERFATLVRRMDDNIGDLRKTLEDLGIADNTLIVLTSDNGPHSESYYPAFEYSPESFQSYGPFEGQKRDCWEGGIREPAIVCWPGKVPAGSLTTLPTQFHDWLPTLCDIAQIEAPARTDGVSLLPTLADPTTTEQETPTVYLEYSTKHNTPKWSDFTNHGGTTRKQAQVIFLDGYKGIRNNPKDETGDFKIYDTVADPDEAKDLRTTSAEFRKLNERMKERVLQVRQPDPSASRPWDTAAVPPARDLPPVTAGTHYKTFAGLWPWIPDFDNMKATGSDHSKGGWDLSTLSETKHDDGLLYEGFLKVPTTGTWTFTMKSDSGAFFRIHDSMVVDDDFNHDGSERTGTLILKAGLHPYRLYYRNCEGATPELSLQWSGPETAQEAIPLNALFVPSQ